MEKDAQNKHREVFECPAPNLALLLLTPQGAHGGEVTVGQRSGFGRTEVSAPGDARTAGVTGSENGVFKSRAVQF